MVERLIVLIRVHDPERAERLAAAVEADGDLLAVTDAAEPPDVSLREAASGDAIEIGVGADAPAAIMPSGSDDTLLVAATRLVLAGYELRRATVRDDDQADHDLQEPRRPPERRRPSLSARELEVLGLLADGASNKVIARALDISVHTAKFHIASLLSKLGAVNRTDALAIAMREGLTPM